MNKKLMLSLLLVICTSANSATFLQKFFHPCWLGNGVATQNSGTTKGWPSQISAPKPGFLKNTFNMLNPVSSSNYSATISAAIVCVGVLAVTHKPTPTGDNNTVTTEDRVKAIKDSGKNAALCALATAGLVKGIQWYTAKY